MLYLPFFGRSVLDDICLRANIFPVTYTPLYSNSNITSCTDGADFEVTGNGKLIASEKNAWEKWHRKL